MTHSISSTRRAAARSLALMMTSVAIGWILFIAGQYAELLYSQNTEWRVDDPEQPTFARYFTVAAITVFGCGALLAKRRLARIRETSAPRSKLVEPVSRLASTVLLLAMVFAALAVFVTFMGGFFSGSTETAPLARIVNLYAPIVLYTALIVTLILAGFVFSPQVVVAVVQPVTQEDPAPLAPVSVASAAASAPSEPTSFAPATRVEPVPPPTTQLAPTAQTAPTAPTGKRATALAYAIPIIAAAIALILGLIVYDLTRTALQVWIWVVIFVIVGGGVLAGTLSAASASAARGSASRAVRNESDAVDIPIAGEASADPRAVAAPVAPTAPSAPVAPVPSVAPTTPSAPVPPVVTGAKNLNFVLSILFAITVASMSLGYGISAVNQLHVWPSLSLSAYGDSEDYSDTGRAVTVSEPRLSLWGSDIKRGSEVSVVLEPGGERVIRAEADRNEWVSAEEAWPRDIAPGDYEFVIRATASDGVPIELELRATVTDTGEVHFPDGNTSSFEIAKGRLMPVSAGWLLGELLPAGVLLLLGIATVSATVSVRNRERA